MKEIEERQTGREKLMELVNEIKLNLLATYILQLKTLLATFKNVMKLPISYIHNITLHIRIF